MLIIPLSIKKREFEKFGKYYSEKDILKMAIKIKNGLGITLRKKHSWNVVKLKTTTKAGAIRAVFFLMTTSGNMIPIFIRPKNDSIGENISLKNKTFRKTFEKYEQMIKDDLKTGDIEVIEI